MTDQTQTTTLADLAVSGLEGVREGFESAAEMFGLDAPLTLRQIIEVLRASEESVRAKVTE